MNGEEGIELFRSELHADGVRTTRCVAKDEVIYQERPRLFLQSIANRSTTLVCGHCARFVGSVGLQLKYLQKLFDRTSLCHTPEECMGESYETLSRTICPCNLQCGEYYCSAECRELHWETKGHKFMCTGTLYQDTATESSLYKFKTFCVQTNEIFLMIGNMIAEICCFLDQMPDQNPLEMTVSALSNYESYVHNLWWDVATLSMKKGSKDKARLDKSLKGLVKEATQLLRETLRLKERGLHNIFNEELISRTIGMFEQNNIGARLANPIMQFIERLEDGDALLPDIREQVECVYDMIDDEADVCDEEFEDVDDEEDDSEANDDDEPNDAAVSDDDEDNVEEEDDENLDSKEATAVASTITESRNQSSKNSKQAILQFIEESGGSDTMFPPLDGTGFYMTTCKINHSCDPNVYVRFAQHQDLGLVLELVALKNISKGEELIQSYIDQTLPKQKRQKSLRDYGFQCHCQKCSSE